MAFITKDDVELHHKNIISLSRTDFGIKLQIVRTLFDSQCIWYGKLKVKEMIHERSGTHENDAVRVLA